MKTTQELARDAGGNTITKLDKYRSKLTPYSYNGDLYNADAGRQAKANASGHKIYITGIYLKNNKGTGYQFIIYDGTVAAGTAMVDVDVALNAEPDLHTAFPIGPFEDTSGIYVWGANGNDFSIILDFVRDPNTVE